MSDLLLTSGYNFEGYRITKYINFCTGECALGTGFLSSFGAGLADILGSNSSMYEGKLNRAKEMALRDLKSNVRACGGNAIIGLDVDYTTFTSDIMGVIANGTAVYIEPINITADTSNQLKYYISDYNLDLKFKPFQLIMNDSPSGYSMSVEVISYVEQDLEAIEANISFNTIFNDEYTIEHLYFINFTKENNKYISTSTNFIPPANILPIIKNAYFKINKYILNGIVYEVQSENSIPSHDTNTEKLKRLYGNDAVCEYNESESSWTCVCGNVNKKAVEQCSLCTRKKNFVSTPQSSAHLSANYLEALEQLNSVREFLEYTEKLNAENNNIISEEIVSIISKASNTERLYGGSMKESCLKNIREHLKEK